MTWTRAFSLDAPHKHAIDDEVKLGRYLFSSLKELWWIQVQHKNERYWKCTAPRTCFVNIIAYIHIVQYQTLLYTERILLYVCVRCTISKAGISLISHSNKMWKNVPEHLLRLLSVSRSCVWTGIREQLRVSYWMIILTGFGLLDWTWVWMRHECGRTT